MINEESNLSIVIGRSATLFTDPKKFMRSATVVQRLVRLEIADS